MGSSKNIDKSLDNYKARAKEVEKNFDDIGAKIERAASREMNLFSDDVLGFTGSIAEAATKVSIYLYTNFQSMVGQMDREFRPYIYSREISDYQIAEVYFLIRKLNDDSNIDNNYSLDYNHSGSNRLLSAKLTPTSENVSIERYWKSKYESTKSYMDMKKEEREKERKEAEAAALRRKKEEERRQIEENKKKALEEERKFKERGKNLEKDKSSLNSEVNSLQDRIAQLEKQKTLLLNDQKTKQERISKDIAVMKRNSIKRCVITVITVIATACLVVYGAIFPRRLNYNRAISAFNNKQYEAAISMFEELGDYKESETMIKECKYAEGIALLNSGENGKAVVKFEELNGYKDSANAIKLAFYNEGVKLMNEKNYIDAKSHFDKNPDYLDSENLSEKCHELEKQSRYNKGMEYYNDGSYERAKDEFFKASGYKNANEMMQKCETQINNQKSSASSSSSSSGSSGSSSTKEKVTCSMCNGTGKVKYYYGDSALEAALNGYNDYEYGICTSCDGKGYSYVKTSGSSSGSSSGKVTCPSCGKKVSKLSTKKDKSGVSRTWCSSCWSDYYSIMGY